MKRSISTAFVLVCILTGLAVAAGAPTVDQAASGVNRYFASIGKTVYGVTVQSVGAMQSVQTSKGAISCWTVKAGVTERGGIRDAEGLAFVMPAGVSFDRADDGRWSFQPDAASVATRINEGDPPLISANNEARRKGELAKSAQEYFFSQNNRFTDQLPDLAKIDPRLASEPNVQFTFGPCNARGFSFSVRHAKGNKSYEFKNQ